MTDRPHKFVYLLGPTQKQHAKSLIDAATPDMVMAIRKVTRSFEQNSKLWAMLQDVARAKPEGRSWTPDTWKAAFMHALGHQIMFCEGLDNTGPGLSPHARGNPLLSHFTRIRSGPIPACAGEPSRSAAT